MLDITARVNGGVAEYMLIACRNLNIASANEMLLPLHPS